MAVREKAESRPLPEPPVSLYIYSFMSIYMYILFLGLTQYLAKYISIYMHVVIDR